VSIPSSVTSIGQSTFEDCTSLTSVIIPSSVTFIHFDAFKRCSSLIYVIYQGTNEPDGYSSCFDYCDALELVCVPADYTSSSFAGLHSICKSSSCEELASNINNYCFEIVVDGDNIGILQKRSNATAWESQTNGCIHYYCDNESGGVSWSMCNSTDDTSRICVENECKDNTLNYVPINDGEWTVEIIVDGIDTNDVNINEIIETTSAMCGVDKNKLKIGLEFDDHGRVTRIYVIVDDKNTADVISQTVNYCTADETKGESKCDYDIVLRMKRARVMDVRWLVSETNKLHAHIHEIISSILFLVITTLLWN